MVEIYDVIVVGAGIFGTCAAYHCQKKGLKTVLVEQFDLGHKNGSSHGLSRIIRYAHTEREYVPLVSDAYEQIAELEKKTGKDLWKQTGLLWASTPQEVASMSKILKDLNIEHETIDGEEVSSRYPQFKFDKNWSALVDPKGGVLYADKWLRTFQDEFANLGGTIRNKEEVLSYAETCDDTVELTTSKSLLRARKVIFTVGSWFKALFHNIPLNVQPESVAVCYWKAVCSENTHMLEFGKFPVFIASGDDGLPFGFFGLPSIDYDGCVKICYHGGERIDGFHHPEAISQQFISYPAKFIKNHIPIIDADRPAHVDTCKYTVSEDHHYVIGRYPGTNNVFVGGCGSGSGFKVAPAIGKVLSEMAAGEKTSIDVSFFSFDRFVGEIVRE